MENFHEIDLKAVGARIRNARHESKITQEKAAELVSLSSQFWSRIENGHESARIGTYLQIADIFGLTLDDLFYDNPAVTRICKNPSFDALLPDCTSFEKNVIAELLLAAREILFRARKS